MNETHTLASALRPLLECNNPDDYVACTQQHPLDDFVRVDVPTEEALRRALVTIKEQIALARREIVRNGAAPSHEDELCASVEASNCETARQPKNPKVVSGRQETTRVLRRSERHR
jgi:hypothetical protein